MQAFEFQVSNYLEQVLRMDFGSAMASGNGQFMTLEMASAVRWHSSLLDDLEFSINGFFKGFYGGFLPNVLMPQEAVTTYKALVKQRTRWCQGGMQCLFSYGKRIFINHHIPSRLKANLLLFMLIPFGSMIFSIGAFESIITMYFLLIHNYSETIGIIAIILIFGVVTSAIMTIAAFRMHLTDHQKFNFMNSLKMSLGNLLYIWCLVPIPFISLWRLLTGQNNWVKTAHTVSHDHSEEVSK
jgi:cellulose synthase/poly-beta-1,6-N-acetylglucosamine synthase-like glycosyltransferase